MEVQPTANQKRIVCRFLVTPTGDEGCNSGRPRYHVRCMNCNSVIHANTTGPEERMRYHSCGMSIPKISSDSDAPPEGMVRTVIDLPEPPVPYERVSWRKLKYQDWYLSALYKWEQCNNEAYCSDYKMLCLDIPAPKIQFPASVPGFKKGTWFARDERDGWFAYSEKPDIAYAASTGWSGQECTFIPKYLSAREKLHTLNSIPWRESLFQTQEDG